MSPCPDWGENHVHIVVHRLYVLLSMNKCTHTKMCIIHVYYWGYNLLYLTCTCIIIIHVYTYRMHVYNIIILVVGIGQRLAIINLLKMRS